MRTITATVPVNEPVDEPGRTEQVRLDRDEVWAGLLDKAQNAVPYVPGMQECTVVERGPEGLVREVVIHGERVREEVVFHPKRRVTFSRDDERATWLIHNDIGEDETGLTLTFSATMDLAEGEEGDHQAERVREGYLEALRTTLARTRENVAAGRAPAVR
ncbi:SRPBCC family protein [Streptomyces albireticuli]|uniref:SRPBCC family protein n=1 Tax=Streptomyces albireticuli TaxID=1940 RepID=UPI0036B50527